MEELPLTNAFGAVIEHPDGSRSIDYGDLALPVMPPGMPLRPEEAFDRAAFYEHMEALRRAFPETIPTEEERLRTKADAPFRM